MNRYTLHLPPKRPLCLNCRVTIIEPGHPHLGKIGFITSKSSNVPPDIYAVSLLNTNHVTHINAEGLELT